MKQPRSLRLAAGTASILAGILAAGTVQAQEGAFDLAQATEVSPLDVVGERAHEHPYADPEAPYKTDRSASDKFTEPLLDVSKSVTVLSDQVIEDSGATTFRDLMRTQPGVTLGTGEGGNAFGDRIFIRGFDARNDIYVDGVRDPGVGSREVFAVEQIEILKGPSSAFGGRGTTGGAVSLVSKQPTDMNFGDIEATLGTDEARRLTVDINRALTEKLSVRLNAMVHHAGVGGRDYVEGDRWGVAAAIQFRPIEGATLSADYFHLTTDAIPDWGVPYDVANNRPFKVDRDNFYGVLDRDFMKTFMDIFTARAEMEVNDALTLNSLVRWGSSGNAYTASAPEQPNATARTVRANPKRRDAVTDTFVNQTQATFRFDTGAIGHTLIAGAEFSREKVINRGRAFTECATLPCTGPTGGPVLNLDNPDPTLPWTVTDNGITNRTRITVDSKGFFLLDTLKFSERWEAFGGVRWDDYDIDFRQVNFISGAIATRGARQKFWNWHAGLTFKPASNASLYASMASSSNPSGEQLDSLALDYGGLDVRTVNLDPERNKAYEVGAKWNVFDEHLSLTAAAFRIDKENARVANAQAVVTLEGEQRVQGIELTASGKLLEKLSVFGGYTWLDTEIRKSPVASQVGAKFPNVPEHSFNLTTRYQVNDRAFIGGTATYNSKRYGGTVVALATQIPDYWRFDLFGGYQVTDRIEVSFNVLNVGNEVYYDAIYRSGTPFTYIAPGRSAQIKIDYDF